MLKQFYLCMICLSPLLVACNSESNQPLLLAPPTATVSRPQEQFLDTPRPNPVPMGTIARPAQPIATYPPLTPVIETGNPDDGRLILAFLNAYNAGQFEAALALLDERIYGSDCDFQAEESID